LNPGYFSVRELADGAFGYGGHGLLMSLRAFYDGAGKKSDPILTVGGYFADDEVCEAIEADWLKATGGKVFHLADFGTQYCELGSHTWTKDERRNFLKMLGVIVNRQDVYIISASAEMSEYAAFLSAASYAKIFGPAYSGLASLCADTTERTLLKFNRLSEKMVYTFEKGEREHELVQTLNDFERRRPQQQRDLRSHLFMPKSTPLLQPADLIAGTVQHVLLRAQADGAQLDNGRICTKIDEFEKYYSKDGVTAAVIPPYNGTMLRFVANRILFHQLDWLTSQLERARPEVLRKRMKQSNNQGKRHRHRMTGHG